MRGCAGTASGPRSEPGKNGAFVDKVGFCPLRARTQFQGRRGVSRFGLVDPPTGEQEPHGFAACASRMSKGRPRRLVRPNRQRLPREDATPYSCKRYLIVRALMSSMSAARLVDPSTASSVAKIAYFSERHADPQRLLTLGVALRAHAQLITRIACSRPQPCRGYKRDRAL